jgi:hypothetical protein
MLVVVAVLDGQQMALLEVMEVVVLEVTQV